MDASTVKSIERDAAHRLTGAFQRRAGGLYSGAGRGRYFLGVYGLRGLQGHLRPFDGALQRGRLKSF